MNPLPSPPLELLESYAWPDTSKGWKQVFQWEEKRAQKNLDFIHLLNRCRLMGIIDGEQCSRMLLEEFGTGVYHAGKIVTGPAVSEREKLRLWAVKKSRGLRI